MVGPQNLAEAFAAAAQIDPNGDHARIQDRGDFPHWVVGVIEEDDGSALIFGEFLQRPDQFTIRVGHLIGSAAIQTDSSAPLLQHAACDPKRRPPYPGFGRADRAPPGECLGKGFGNGIAGNIRVLRECPDSAPESVALRPIQGFNRGVARGGSRALHYPTGGLVGQNVTSVSPLLLLPEYVPGPTMCQGPGPEAGSGSPAPHFLLVGLLAGGKSSISTYLRRTSGICAPESAGGRQM